MADDVSLDKLQTLTAIAPEAVSGVVVVGSTSWDALLGKLK